MGKIKIIGIGFGVVIVLLFMILIIADITYDDSIQQTNSNLEFDDNTYTILHTWSYDEMLRNEKFYVGKVISMHGYVRNYLQYDEREFGLGVCALSDGSGDDGIYNYNPNYPPSCDRFFWVYYTGNRILEKDYVIIEGEFIEITELENSFGTKSYRPLLGAKSVNGI